MSRTASPFRMLLRAVAGAVLLASGPLGGQELQGVQANRVEPPGQIRKEISPGIAETYPAAVERGGVLPVGVGLFPPLQLPGETWDVYGARLDVFVGRHNNVQFLEVGTLANLTLGRLTGLSIAGIWNQVALDMQGLQIAGVGNGIKGAATGMQLAAFVNCNPAWEDTRGCQVACVNLAGEVEGVQIGLFNQAEDLAGIQIGILNRAENLAGVQIGLLNVVRQSRLPWMIGLNVGF